MCSSEAAGAASRAEHSPLLAGNGVAAQERGIFEESSAAKRYAHVCAGLRPTSPLKRGCPPRRGPTDAPGSPLGYRLRTACAVHAAVVLKAVGGLACRGRP
jgi:hypothetical protein